MDDLGTTIANSAVGSAAGAVRERAGDTTVARLLGDERVLLSASALLVLASAVWVLGGHPAAAVDFLSFVLLAVVVTAATWRWTGPSAD